MEYCLEVIKENDPSGFLQVSVNKFLLQILSVPWDWLCDAKARLPTDLAGYGPLHNGTHLCVAM